MSAEVIPFPIVPNDLPERPDEPMHVVTVALCRMNLLMAAYLQPGPRPDAELILMKINEILDEPSLCEAAGIEKIVIKQKMSPRLLPPWRPMSEFNPSSPAILRDDMNNQEIEWSGSGDRCADWHRSATEHTPGVMEWDGFLIDRWASRSSTEKRPS